MGKAVSHGHFLFPSKNKRYVCSSLLEPRLCNSLTDDNDENDDDNHKKARNCGKN